MNSEPVLSFRWGSNTAQFSTEDHRVSDALSVVFGAFQVDATAPGSEFPRRPTLTVNFGGRKVSFPTLGDAVIELEQIISERLLDGCEHLLLHSGAVTNGDRTILILGYSGAGKTTMTLELVRRGFRFMSDEWAVIDVSGNFVHPFPRCGVAKEVVAEVPAGRGFEVETDWCRRSFLLPADRAPLEPQPIGELWLILPKYTKAAETRSKALGTAAVCNRLLPSTVNFAGNEQRLWPALSQVAVHAKACDVEYSDVGAGLDEAFRFLSSL